MKLDETTREEAATWFAALRRGPMAVEERQAFDAWRADPRKQAALDGMHELWGEVSAVRELGVAAPAPRPSLGRMAAGIAAGAVLTAGVLTLAVNPPGGHRLRTDVGEQRTIQLADGSRVMLDTGSHIRVRFSGDRRAVELTSGQAMFEVAASAERPFTVTAGQTEVTATGTRFDVRLDGAGARVVLVEGRVAVKHEGGGERAWTLSPGQEVRTSAPKPVVANVDLGTVTSWTTGRLVFDRTPVTVAVAEVNRYTDKPIEIQDPEVAEAVVSGVFDAGDVDGFVAALEDLYGLETSRSAQGRRVLSPAFEK